MLISTFLRAKSRTLDTKEDTHNAERREVKAVSAFSAAVLLKSNSPVNNSFPLVLRKAWQARSTTDASLPWRPSESDPFPRRDLGHQRCQPAARWLWKAMNTAQHKIVNLLKTL